MNIASFIIAMIVILISSLSLATLIVLLGLWLIDKDDKDGK